MADTGSKWTDDSDDWTIDKESFDNVIKEFRCKVEIDYFADTNNAKCIEFFSKFHCPDSVGTDGFAADWAGKKAWICPPTSKIVQAVKKIQGSANLTGCLLYTSPSPRDLSTSRMPSSA